MAPVADSDQVVADRAPGSADDACDTPPLAAVIVAGGRSRRMGREKASLLLAGRSLLQRTLDAVLLIPAVQEVVLVLAASQVPPPVCSRVPLTLVRDRIQGAGPLAAIRTGLAAAHGPICLVLGCDTPFVQPLLLRLLAERARDHPFVVPLHNGVAQPLCSAIRRDALPIVEVLLDGRTGAASVLADHQQAIRLGADEWARVDPGGVSFIGVNTPDELEVAEVMAAHLDAAQRLVSYHAG